MRNSHVLERRTLCFVLLLFLDNDFRFVAGVSVETITTEYINQPQGPPPPPNSVLSITSTNRFLPDPPAPKVYSYGPYPPPTVVRPNYYETYPAYTTTVEISNPPTKPEPEKVESPPQPPTPPRYPPFPPKPSNPQTIVQETLQTKYFPDRYPQTVETKTTNYTIPSNEMNSNKSVILQINVPAPEPVATILPQPPCMSTYDSSPCGMPPSPLIVMEKSKSSLKSILPILFLSLFDGGRGNNGCCCCPKPNNIPVPYPIPVPYNNPVVTTQGKGKSKKPAKDNDDDDNDDN
ncbi:unnamed protein product [Spodoptera littoralis]|uniref:Uncharacterized protein n=1 Tax=Spodoptera littoralis TaxID=7109 RepID=A0A9P0N6I2_SPOLI|nr:unnamed protein product [Spodoptera littoralis]CAH1643295.1 unnamed protein product [Spodoptera littoralis]